MCVCSADFIEGDGEGGQRITTALLSEYYQRWKRREQFDPQTRRSARERLKETGPYLEEANVIIIELWRRFHDQEIRGKPSSCDSLSPELLLSLQLIGSTLTIARRKIYLFCTDNPYQEDHISLRYHWGYSKTMEQHMLRLGWCPSIVEAFKSKELDVQCFAATLRAPRVKKDHSRCSSRKCFGNQVDEEIYKVEHASGQCTCDTTGPAMDKVVGIIQGGGIPLLELPPESERNTVVEGQSNYLHTVQYQPGMQYVAISHVWKDGLGNPVENTLPSCQIHRIRKIVREMYADK